VRSINKMMESLIGQIKANNAKELQVILSNVMEIAVRYRRLEQDTISIIQQTSIVSEQVRLTAECALEDEMSATEAFTEMDKDFEGLSQDLDTAVSRHCQISQDLKQQADEAQRAKEANDRLAADAKQRRRDAKFYGAMAVPGATILTGPVLGASMASENIDNKFLKVLAGTGGAIGSLLGGVAATVFAPIMAGWAVRCAVLGKKWSITFGNLSEQILAVEEAINKSTMCLSSVRGALKTLGENAAKCDPSTSKPRLRLQYKKIMKNCIVLSKNCDDYQQTLQMNMGTMLDKIQGSEESIK